MVVFVKRILYINPMNYIHYVLHTLWSTYTMNYIHYGVTYTMNYIHYGVTYTMYYIHYVLHTPDCIRART